MPNFFDLLFGPPRKTVHEKFKEKPNFHSCDFGIKEFNKTKRSRLYVEEAKSLQRGKGKKPKPTDPPPPPPPPPDPPATGTKVLLLVFEGDIVAGTSWNVFGSLTMDYSGLDLLEQAIIVAGMQEKYAPFDVLITTDRAIFDATPANLRARVVYTESYEWFGNGAGGVAWINSFGAVDGVCFVFTSLLGYSMKFIGEAGPHEAGHMCGCYHQIRCENGVKVAEYHTGDNGEAPIMGVGYYQPVTKWWVGPSSLGGCESSQDDAAIIGAKLGVKV